jgi:hypothetical protein
MDPSGTHRVLTFFVPIAGERYRYRVELMRDRERLFLDEDAQSFDGVGTFGLLFPVGSLGPGEYEIRVEERERAAGEEGKLANVITFSFSISAQ